MNIKKTKQAGKLTISVTGSLDTTTAPALEAALNGALDGVTELVFDLKELEYISSAGLRILLSSMKTMNQRGSMKVINVNRDIMEIFEMTGFSEVLTIK